MPENIPMSVTKPNPKEEFKQLLTRKQMLQEVLGVADRIEQLHSGLSSAMQMGKQTSNINKELLQDNAAATQAQGGFGEARRAHDR